MQTQKQYDNITRTRIPALQKVQCPLSRQAINEKLHNPKIKSNT